MASDVSRAAFIWGGEKPRGNGPAQGAPNTTIRHLLRNKDGDHYGCSFPSECSHDLDGVQYMAH